MYAAATYDSLIRINLIPEAQGAGTRRFTASRTAVGIIFALAAAFALITVTSVVQSVRIRAVRADIESLQSEARQLQPLIQRIDQLTRERQAVRQRLDVIENLDQNRFERVRLADELSRRLPDQVWLTSFTESQGTIVITGITFSNLSVAEFISRLERSVLYTDVDLVVSRRGNVEEHEVINFTINARHQDGATTTNPAG
ncbi:MAG: PilN domain-containing protein [Candidatus Eiseniibacteriota bacterium]|jgi:type IV pilus assembly protein PilN